MSVQARMRRRAQLFDGLGVVATRRDSTPIKSAGYEELGDQRGG